MSPLLDYTTSVPVSRTVSQVMAEKHFLLGTGEGDGV